ncbi:MAG: GNAT family N-acetyltransferase [Gemmatimonadota bacterium]
MSEWAFHPLTRERWSDFERLFGERGAVGGCWCMWWRLEHSEYEANKGMANRHAMKAIVEAGDPPGILAYSGEEPVGWCAVAPRESYPRLARSRILKPIDDTPVWSVTCLFIDKRFRGRGLSVALLEAACGYVRDRGGRVLEGYPVEPRNPPMPPVFAATGIASAFRAAGFAEVARRSETRPIMRRETRSR